MHSIFRPNYLIIMVIVSLLTTSNVASSQMRRDILLQVGEIHVLEVADATDVVIGNENLISVTVVNNETLVVKAISPGTTELLIKKKNSTAFSQFVIEIASLARPNEQVQLEWLATHMPELSISSHDNFVLIAGALGEEKYQLLEQQAARNPHWLLQVNKLPEPQGRMVELQVKILEVKRQYARQLGIRWPGSYSGPQISDAAESWITLPVAVQSTLNLLEQNGHARVLAEPKLVALSGETAEFLVGGEFPIPQVVGQGMQDVAFREYGITLSMSPVDLGEQNISTAIKAEISTIDPATSVNGIPGMLTRRVSSSITAESGELIVLSGLLSQEQSKQADLFPLLNQVPIIGRLFSSKQFRTAETELLVVVSPQFKADREQQITRVDNAKALISKFRSKVSCVGLIDGF